MIFHSYVSLPEGIYAILVFLFGVHGPKISKHPSCIYFWSAKSLFLLVNFLRVRPKSATTKSMYVSLFSVVSPCNFPLQNFNHGWLFDSFFAIQQFEHCLSTCFVPPARLLNDVCLLLVSRTEGIVDEHASRQTELLAKCRCDKRSVAVR